METFIPSITRGIFKNSIIYYLSLPLPFCGQVPPSPIFYQGDFFPSPVMNILVAGDCILGHKHAARSDAMTQKFFQDQYY